MRHFFQSRAFIAAALLLLLGAVRCIDACQLPDEPVAAKSCHQHPASAKKPCAKLAFVTPEAQDFGEAPVAVSAFELVLTAAVMPLSRAPIAPVRPGPLLLPLRI